MFLNIDSTRLKSNLSISVDVYLINNMAILEKSGTSGNEVHETKQYLPTKVSAQSRATAMVLQLPDDSQA